MSVDANKQIVRTFFELMHGKDFDGAFALLAPEATWWVPTDQPGGMTISKDAIRHGMDAFYSVFATPPMITPGRMTAEDDRVSLEQTGRGGKTHGGVSYDNDYHMLLVVRDGLIREVREFMNPVLSAGLMPEIAAAQQQV
jgi:hypothetical protein